MSTSAPSSTPTADAPSRSAPRTTFSTDKRSFAADLKREVDNYFDETNKSRFANWSMVVKAVLLYGLTFGAYGLIMMGTLPLWAMWVLSGVAGIGIAGLGMAVGHDAIHGGFSKHPAVNKFVGLTFDIMGASSSLWKLTHNRIHHTWTNVPEHDEDIVVSPLLRISPAAEHRWWHKGQHVFAWLLYSFILLNWVWAKDFNFLRAKKIGPVDNLGHTKGRVIGVIAGKLIYHTWTIALPLIFLPIAFWQFLIGYLTMHMVGGFILSIIFQLAHIVEDAKYPMVSPEGALPFNWHVHQMHTTVDFAVNNRALSWYCGGLNHQVEHHLYPRVCSRHYPALRPIVSRVAAKHDVPHHIMPSFVSGLRSHYRMLRRLGRSPDDGGIPTATWTPALN